MMNDSLDIYNYLKKIKELATDDEVFLVAYKNLKDDSNILFIKNNSVDLCELSSGNKDKEDEMYNVFINIILTMAAEKMIKEPKLETIFFHEYFKMKNKMF